MRLAFYFMLKYEKHSHKPPNKAWMTPSSLLFKVTLEVFVNEIRQGKIIRNVRIVQEGVK